MPKAAVLQNAFTGGEFSPLAAGRTDSDRYKTALSTCLNYIPILLGPLVRRPGTKFVAEVKNPSGHHPRLLRFKYATIANYVLEVGDQYIRFYRSRARIESPPGTPVEIATPYVIADVPALRITQTATELFIFHPNYQTRKLTRTSDTSWSLSPITFIDGPYDRLNESSTTLALSATTGSVTVTASAALFTANDVGRLIRWRDPAGNWTWLIITAFTNSTTVTATINGANASAGTATTQWRLGLMSTLLGWPALGGFYQDRLVLAGFPSFPNYAAFSQTGQPYDTFRPSNVNGTVADDNGLVVALAADDVNAAAWIVATSRGLLVGTRGSEWLVAPSTFTAAFSPTNVRADRITTYGSKFIDPVRVGTATLFVQAHGRKVREQQYAFTSDSYFGPDLTVLSEHITFSGIEEMVYQQEPFGVLWARLGNGSLIGLTYERDQQAVRAGWHRHALGGTAVAVESLASIPEPNGTFDDLWLCVSRTINGGTKHYVEYMSPVFDKTMAQADAFFVDCGVIVTGAQISTINGLTWLEGQTVAILADGQVQPSKVVTGGSITLDVPADKIAVGLGYQSDGALLRIDAGAADGTAIGKVRRIHRVAFLLDRSLNLLVGPSFDSFERWIFRTSHDNLGQPTALFTGIVKNAFPANYDMDNFVVWRQDQPLPSTIAAIMVQLDTQDDG